VNRGPQMRVARDPTVMTWYWLAYPLCRCYSELGVVVVNTLSGGAAV
jgi:hypothetical protein